MAETDGQSFRCRRVCFWDVEKYFGEREEDKNGKRPVITGDQGTGAGDDRGPQIFASASGIKLPGISNYKIY